MPKIDESNLGCANPAAVEGYWAPAPPVEGRVIGVDCHPDTFTAAVLVGQSVHSARKLCCRENLSFEDLLKWAAKEFGPQDIFLMEASGNSFEVCKRLHALKLRAVVLESCHVARHAKSYADNDRMAAVRIALVYLAGKAPAVWVPDATTFQRRELLHAYRKAVADDTAARNSLRDYLNGHAIRLGRRKIDQESTRQWILGKANWTALQSRLLEDHFGNVKVARERRKRLYGLIVTEVSAEPMMLRCMKILGVGIINAFALVAVIGEVRRFERPEKLVAYIGLNPGQRQSGTRKDLKLGVGKRGRGDVRHLLIQGAQALLRMGRATTMGQWGWKLFARKGSRNVAVVAVARKMIVQVWHLLWGNPPMVIETDRSFSVKLTKVVTAIDKALRQELNLGKTLAECTQELARRIRQTPTTSS